MATKQMGCRHECSVTNACPVHIFALLGVAGFDAGINQPGAGG